VALKPELDVALENSRFISLSREPWLRIDAPFPSSRFVEIVYRASLLDDPVRPVLRFVCAAGVVERILPGPVAGAAVWRGAIPKGLLSASISPTNRPGRFDFQIESIRPVSLFETLASTCRRKPAKLWSFLIPTLFGYRAEAENALDWVNNSEPLEAFESWLSRRERPFEPDGLDAPRSETTPTFVILLAGDGAAQDWARTIDSVAGQTYAHWRLIVADDEARAITAECDPRIALARAGDAASPLLAGAGFIGRLRPGDALAPHALACLAEAARARSARMLYADEIIRGARDRRPSFKPDWSPIFESARPYLGRCAFSAVATLDPPPATLDGDALAHALRSAFLRAAPGEIVHLRRWLLTRAEEAPTVPAAVLPEPDDSAPPSVSIILLTRDRPDLLGPCLDSVLRLSTHPSFELIIVDNGSRRAKTHAILTAARKDSRVRVLERPEPFNFARLNNDAARAATGEVLLFLNNDTIVQSIDWLERMARRAVAPATGAIGALLLFPDGRVQHAGVAIGLGQDAGHFGALAPPEAPSWLDRTSHIHETTAVTAACMAVERRKFDAVGGFDETRLPIEFNDTDLCMRLAEMGWTSLYVPQARLLHLESASRGSAAFRPMSVYAQERSYFRDRWRGVIRDDPFYHPAMSLYARHPTLW
jgi:GT2 family glycosyltransferase